METFYLLVSMNWSTTGTTAVVTHPLKGQRWPLVTFPIGVQIY